MIHIGIDPSINSTGVCILSPDTSPIYYIIVPKLTKKMASIQSDRFKYLTYSKSTDLNDNIRQITYNIKTILERHSPDRAVMEAPAFQANGRIIDLSVLSGYIRCILDLYIVDYRTVPPTSIKKFFTGNGQADKDVMIHSWSKLDPEMSKTLETVKVDDIADAYAMASYSRELN